MYAPPVSHLIHPRVHHPAACNIFRGLLLWREGRVHLSFSMRMMSIGSGKMIVEFFSVAISVRVCR